MVKKPNYLKLTSKVPDWFLLDNGIQEHPRKKCCKTTPQWVHVLDFHLSLCPCLFLCLCLPMSLGLSLHMCLLACLTLSLPFWNFWSNIYLVSSFQFHMPIGIWGNQAGRSEALPYIFWIETIHFYNSTKVCLSYKAGNNFISALKSWFSKLIYLNI